MMSPTLQFFFYLAALICFVLAAVANGRWAWMGKVNLIAAGLAFWVFVVMWAAFEAAF